MENLYLNHNHHKCRKMFLSINILKQYCSIYFEHSQRSCLVNDDIRSQTPYVHNNTNERNVKITLTIKQISIKFNVNGHVPKQKSE